MKTLDRSSTNTTWPRAVIFDLDGTLIDSVPDIAGSLNEVLGRRDLPPFPLDRVKDMIGGGISRLVMRALEAHGVAPDDTGQLIEDMISVYAKRATAETVLYDGAEDVLGQLHDAGVTMALCTNKTQDLTDIIVRDLGIARYFSSVVGHQPGRPHKPEPGALQIVLDELGMVASQAVMVGDSGADAGAAKAIGMPLVLASFGYSHGPVQEYAPDAIFDSFGELPGALQALASRRA